MASDERPRSPTASHMVMLVITSASFVVGLETKAGPTPVEGDGPVVRLRKGVDIRLWD